MQSTAPHAVSLRQWQYVVAVAEARSFSKAAEACHVAQPSLSAQVAQVEQALGVKLFERDKRRVLVTAEGQALIERARALLLAADELAEAAESLRDPFRGPMRVGVIPTVGPYLLPEIAPASEEDAAHDARRDEGGQQAQDLAGVGRGVPHGPQRSRALQQRLRHRRGPPGCTDPGAPRSDSPGDAVTPHG